MHLEKQGQRKNNMDEKELEDLKNKVKKSVKLFIDNDKELLELKVYEPAVSHRIAVYLEKIFDDNDLNFDCEYDKHFNFPKAMPAGKEIRPDILVHGRNKNSHNTLVIEVKKSQKSKWDERKLEMLTDKSGEYGYDLGAFIYFPKSKPTVEWIVNSEGSNFELL